MQQWREKAANFIRTKKYREYNSPTKCLVPIKNSFHLVEIAPRCEKTNNRGMVMEALQSLHQYNKLGSKAKLLSEFSLLDLDHLTTCLHLFQIRSTQRLPAFNSLEED